MMNEVESCSSMIPNDVIQTHILSRLDGPTLASASCASSELHASSSSLWRPISSATWPSTNTLQPLISAFPHRSFFADAYTPTTRTTTRTSTSTSTSTSSFNNSSNMISAVDIYYKNINSHHLDVILSKVHELETDSTWFRSTPFWVDLLDPKVKSPSLYHHHQLGLGLELELELEKHLRLSWIVIDPTRKRAANLSSFRPVSVQRHWLTGDMQVRFGSVVKNEENDDYYYCGILVAMMSTGGGGVREVSMQIEDVDGKILNGEDSMVILQGILECQERKKTSSYNGKERYLEYVEMKRERVEKKERRERNIDMVCMTLGFAIFIAFCSLLLSLTIC